MKHLVLFFLLSTFTFFQSHSCNCSDRSFVQQSEWSDEIFIGRLIKKEAVHEKYAEVLDSLRYFVFDISKKWKGNEARQITIIESNSTCDMPFDSLGEEYIIYAYKDNFNTYTTSRCTRSTNTNLFDENLYDDRKLLNAKFPTQVELVEESPKEDSFLILSTILIAVFFYWRKINSKANK